MSVKSLINQKRVVLIIVNIIISKAVLFISIPNCPMQPFDIQKLAHEACYATQYAIKSSAQENFYKLCMNLSQAQLEHLIKNYSQNVLFVTLEYIQKIGKNSKEIRPFLIVINEAVQQWFGTNTNARLIRSDGVPLQFHVQNSVGRTLGQCLKHIYIQKELKQWVSEFISSRPNQRYRLYLWKIFIQAVSVVDSELTFLVYRSLIYSFQQHIIPLIMDALLPFFKSVREEIQVSDLTIFQARLTMQENVVAESNPEVSLFNPSEVKFTDMVFTVLKEVICFNYNITYSQFESQVPIENCLVCFPDEVTRKITNKEFVSSIFYVAEKLITDNFQKSNLNSTFLATTLECVKKIVLTKLFYTPSDVKDDFIKTVLSCMSKILSCKGLDQGSILTLIESNYKFLINIQLHVIRSHQKEFQQWILRIKSIIMQIVTNKSINIDSQLVIEAVELVNKIVEEAVAPQLKNQLITFKNFGIQVISTLVERIFSQEESIVGSGKIRSYQDLKKSLSEFLKNIRQLTCLGLEPILTKIQPLIINSFQKNNVNAISNIYFFFAQFCDYKAFEKNMIYELQPASACSQLGKLLYYCLQWIDKYHSYGQSVEIIDISILFYIEKLLAEVLSNFTYEDNQIKISTNLFKYIGEGRPFMTNDEFLTFCYREIARNLTNGDFNRSSYTFQVLTTLLLKFKWGIKRQYFRQTVIAQSVLQHCKQLSQTQFDGQMLTLRKELYKIITNISFDDTLDDYRTSIDELIHSLQRNLYKNRWRVMYDLTGICEAIDTSAIYRYFIITLQKSQISITTIMNELFNHIDQASGNNKNTKIELVKSILKLQLSMIDNKGQRLSSHKNTFYNYKLISYLMPYWASLLQFSQFKSEDWDEVIIQIYRIFNTMLKNGNTNFFMLERTIKSYGSFVKGLLFNMINISKWVELYPTLFIQYRNALQNIGNYLMEVIFCNRDPEVVYSFNIILNDFMGVIIKLIQSLNQGNKSIEDNLETSLDIIKNVFKYLKAAKKLEHKKAQIENFPILNQGMQKKLFFVQTLFKMGISWGKKLPRILQQICRIINNMDFLAGVSIPVISTHLGLPEHTHNSLLRIWKEVESNKGQFGFEEEGEAFIIELKDWFKKCNTSTMPEPDY